MLGNAPTLPTCRFPPPMVASVTGILSVGHRSRTDFCIFLLSEGETQ